MTSFDPYAGALSPPGEDAISYTPHGTHIYNNNSWSGTSWTRPEDDLASAELPHDEIRKWATAALRAADVRHVVPTPLHAIREQLQLTTVDELEEFAYDVPPSIRERMRRLRERLPRKIRGFLAMRERIVYVDQTLRNTQSRFVLGHELGHHALPWQRDAYQIDTDATLTPNVRARFEREANSFAAELLFNIDELKLRSVGAPLSLSTPAALHTEFDASLIATTRRYVEGHDAAAALLFLGEHPTVSLGRPGTRIMYGVQSPKFAKLFGPVIPGLRLSPAWPWDHHDLAHDAYRAVTNHGEDHVRGAYTAHIDVEFNYEVYRARPFPFVLLTPRRRLQRRPRTRIVTSGQPV